MKTRLVLMDVEATSMSPMSGEMTEFGAVDLETGRWFRGILWDADPNPANPAISVLKKANPHSFAGFGAHDLDAGLKRSYSTKKEVFLAHNKWLKEVLGDSRPVFVSDNPGYDFQWVNCGYDVEGLPNPYGYSSRRIGDIFAGLTLKFTNTSRWKGMRETPHTHESHADSMGNREALLKIQQMVEEIRDNYPDHDELIRDISQTLRKKK